MIEQKKLCTFKNCILKGMELGSITGFLVTLFDSLFMFIPDLYVPFSYPILLIIFNILFWLVIGVFSGFVLWVITRRKQVINQHTEQRYWVVCYLIPFALIYGILGRVFVPVMLPTAVRLPLLIPFDYFASFLWAAIIILFLTIYPQRERTGSAPTFVLEILSIIMLFYFCSNIMHYMTLFNLSSGESPRFTSISSYGAGLIIVGTLYFIFRFKFNSFITLKGYSLIVVLAVLILFVDSVFFIRKYLNNSSEASMLADAARQSQTHKNAPPVILIVLDTVRADHLSIYGYPSHTPYLDAFAHNALVFDNCISNSSWTLPSHASLFTGLYPNEHGVHGDLTKKWELFFPQPKPLASEYLTLAEIFRNNGYITGALVSNFGALNKMFKLDQGFLVYDSIRNIGDIYYEYPFHPISHFFSFVSNFYPKYFLRYRSADDINTISFSFLNKVPDSPFLLFMNYMDAHRPYSPPRPFNSYFLDTTFLQPYKLKQHMRHLAKRYYQTEFDLFHMAQYDGSISYLDNQLGDFFNQLKERGLYDSALIIVTSDHGELFGENGIYGHKVPMYEGAMRVPLIIKFPFNKQTGRENSTIQLSDIFALVLSICGLPVPEGTSERITDTPAAFPVGEFEEYTTGQQRVLYKGKYKYMYYEKKKGPELYDMIENPLESKNLINSLPAIAQDMQCALKQWEHNHKPRYSTYIKEDPTTSKEIVERLKALGYVQ